MSGAGYLNFLLTAASIFCGVKLFARHQMMVHSTALGNCQYLTVSHTLEFALYTRIMDSFDQI